MKIYVDMCALKRPFDNQSQGRIWLESRAVTLILRAFVAGDFTLCNSSALEFENLQNPNPRRRARAAALLASFGRPAAATGAIFQRAEEVRALGFRDMDALHLSFAEDQAADYFVTTDDDVLRRSRTAALKVKVVDPVTLMRMLNL
ncbi:MAG: type II toxin-antitoxin system VapC family toxin [Planctomycetes bacterium]|nr:type II toxin-antitoxin system VapC family toxin [Planctomycetota bacterium]